MGRVVILVRICLKIRDEFTCPGFFLVILCYLIIPADGFSQSFMRVNSGTKADIRKVTITHDGTGYFLTDKVYCLENDIWKEIDFPVSEPNRTLEAVSPLDIRFSATLETSTSTLYYYHDGIT